MYNLPTVKESIYLTPASLAKIFSGEIQNWNDPALAKDNERVVRTPVFETKKVSTTNKGKKPKIKGYTNKTVNIDLPNQPITVWYRTDSSGTSENFTRFLKGANAASNPALWPKAQNTTFTNGMPKAVSNFFNFQGASGSAATAAGVASRVGSITYSELSFATDNKLPVALIQNANGEFVAPDAAGTSTFLGGGTINDNGTVSVDFVKKIPGAYSLGTTSYALAYKGARQAAQQQIVASFLTYVLEKCPTKYPEKGFALITGPLATKAKEQIAKIK
jgi:phosphate transport system substrate-binding protein